MTFNSGVEVQSRNVHKLLAKSESHSKNNHNLSKFGNSHEA
jgi:hypothetical protein